MSVRPSAPYRDRLEDGGTTLIYEGHDQPRGLADPKLVDQVDTLPTGTLTSGSSPLERSFSVPVRTALRAERASLRPGADRLPDEDDLTEVMAVVVRDEQDRA